MTINGQLPFLLSIYALLTAYVAAIPLELFYPFGEEAGDILLPRNDDGSSDVVMLSPQFTFFGKQFDSIYVNNNGHLSPGVPYSEYIPQQLPLDIPLIAVFWGDVDTTTSDGGFVWYRNTTSEDLLQRALKDIQEAYPLATDINYLFIATWDHVGYFRQKTDKNNTFQCVLAGSGNQSYAIYLYADGLIQWTSSGESGFGGNAALVGYNAGDGVTSFTLPGSHTDDFLNIVSISNVNVPGMLVFRLDEDDVVHPPCGFGALSLSPRFGCQLGGTAIEIHGACFQPINLQPRETVECSFGGITTPGIFVSLESVICVSPAMKATGRIQVVVEVRNQNGDITMQGFATFISIPILSAHGVDVQPSLEVDPRSQIQITWDPMNVFPLVEDPNSFTVDVYVYTYNYKDAVWELYIMYRGPPNSAGKMTFQMGTQLPKEVRMTCIHVTVGRETNNSPNNTKQLLNAIQSAKNIPFPNRVGIWSGLLFASHNERGVTEENARTNRNNIFDSKCREWRDDETERLLDNILQLLPSCPPTLDRALLPNSGLEEQRFESSLYTTNYHSQWMDQFHPGVSKCFIQAIVTSGSPGQECCYNAEDNLVVGSQSGGSVNRFAPVDFDSFYQHIQHDIIPYVHCCPRACREYYIRRPSDDGTRYRPLPPACIYGDPHVITLDGLKYTFNGKGEFTLIETKNNLFTLQGRMVEVESEFGSTAPATVFSAIAGKQNDSDTVQFTFGADDEIHTTVEGDLVDFEIMTEQSFLNVVVMDKGNATYSAGFSSGAYIEVRSANGFISLLLVSLANNFVNMTQGLMGSFNGDTLDDLLPKTDNGTEDPISTNSSLEIIHYQFGLTWIIDDPEDSLFSYQQTLGESWAFFYDPDYTPAFSPTFDDPVLEEQASDICGDSHFCLFDIAATRRPEIGMITAVNSEEFEMVVNMSQPVVCVPSCKNGACVATNVCMCTEGYIGDTCSVAVITDCEENECENGGTCQMLAGSIICTCRPHLTGVLCELLLPPKVVNDTIANTPLMSVPLIVDPVKLGFIDYRDLISLCYEIRGAPRKHLNLVSTKCTSISAHYMSLDGNSAETTIGAVGIRTVDDAGQCGNIQVNRDCSVLYNKETLSSNHAVNNISIEVLRNSTLVSVPNCGKEIVIHFHCQRHPSSNTPVMSITITRNFIEQDLTHGLIGQFWSAAISSKAFEGDRTGLVPGYDPYTMTVEYPQATEARTFVGVLIPRLWNHDSAQCIYAGNSQGGSTGTGPSAPMDSVIEGEYRDYRVTGLFGVDSLYSKFETKMCI